MSEDTVKRPGAMAVPGVGAFFPPAACRLLASTVKLANTVMKGKYTPEEEQIGLDLLAACETGAGS